MHGGGFETRGEAAAVAIRQRQARFIGAAIVTTVLVMMMLRPGSGTGRFSGERLPRPQFQEMLDGHHDRVDVEAMEGVAADEDGKVRFLVVGDWGTGGDTDDGHRQTTVAKTMSTVAGMINPSFVLSTGDQMYDYGVQNVDDQLFATHFERVYEPFRPLQIPWFMSVGNHDCIGNVSAQVEYSSRSKLWRMPGRYYTREVRFGPEDDDRALFVVLDACALVCGDGKDFRCEDKMAQNMEPGIAQTHLDWIDAALAPAAKWKIVMAHWPIYSFMGNGPSAVLERELVPRMVQAGVQVYFSGHDHSLQHVRLKPSALTGIKAKAAALAAAQGRGGGHEHGVLASRAPDFFVSGGGGYRLHPELKQDADRAPNDRAESVFAASTFGFATAVLSREQLELEFIAANGSRIYKVTREV